jgi:hypothetical protein
MFRARLTPLSLVLLVSGACQLRAQSSISLSVDLRDAPRKLLHTTEILAVQPGTLLDCLCRQIAFSLEMVVHTPLASARPLLNRFRTHTYITSLPKKFLRALYQILTRVHVACTN